MSCSPTCWSSIVNGLHCCRQQLCEERFRSMRRREKTSQRRRQTGTSKVWLVWCIASIDKTWQDQCSNAAMKDYYNNIIYYYCLFKLFMLIYWIHWWLQLERRIGRKMKTLFQLMKRCSSCNWTIVCTTVSWIDCLYTFCILFEIAIANDHFATRKQKSLRFGLSGRSDQMQASGRTMNLSPTSVLDAKMMQNPQEIRKSTCIGCAWEGWSECYSITYWKI